MVLEVDDFISKFHNLEGMTISAKKKSLFLLLQHIPQDDNKLLNSLVPKNHLENLFKLEIILKLQKIPELIDILKSEEHLAAKILKKRWFCKKLATLLDENSTDFVNGVLPCMSYVMRKRLLNKLALYGSNLDNVFDDVCNRYGINIALNVLMGCSEPKIEGVMKSHPIEFPLDRLKLLYIKYPKLFNSYLKDHRNIDEYIVTYIASTNIQEFTVLVMDHGLRADLGKRLTRRLLTNFKDLLFSNANKFVGLLHTKTAIKVLRDDLKQFYFKCLPKNIDDITRGYALHNLTKNLGNREYPFLREGLEKIYKKSIYDFPDLVDDKMLESMDINEREKWIRIKKEKGTPEMDLIKYMPTKEAITLIKSKINVTSNIGKREELIQLLVTVCKINNDLNALAEVGDYVCFRHRNDDVTVLAGFIFQIENSFDLEKMEERHWKTFNAISKLISSTDYYSSRYKGNFLIKYIDFLISCNRIADEEIMELIKYNKSWHKWNDVLTSKKAKIILLKFIELMPKLMEKDDKPVYFDLLLIHLIIDWNKKNPNDVVSIYDQPRLLQSFYKALEEMQVEYEHDIYYHLNPILNFFICTKENSSVRDQIIETYFTLDMRALNHKILFWLLKFQPEIIRDNFSQFLNCIVSTFVDLAMFQLIKKYSFLSFPEKIISYCLEQLQVKEMKDISDGIFKILAILMPIGDFVEFVQPFYPNSDKSDDSGNKAFAIAESFKYTRSVEALPTLITYCKGDYLGRSLESLYYLFYHSPENKLSIFINELSSKAVSVRKHAFFLTCIVGTVDDVQKLLRRFIENERNVSVQKHLFTATLKYFIKNPSDEFWEFLKLCMMKLDRNDSESFAMLVKLSQIPNKYKGRHVVFVWQILKEKEDLDKNRPRLLSSIPSEIFKDLPLEFLLEVIRDNFLKSSEYAINRFVSSALIETEHKMEILNEIFTIIEDFKNVKYDNLAKEKEARETMYYFISNFVEDINKENQEILGVFSERWHRLFTVPEFIEEHLKITFKIFIFQSDYDLLKFSEAAANFLDSLVATYGIVIVEPFATVLKDSLQNFLRCYSEINEKYFEFCLNLLKKDNLIFYLLVLKLLPTTEPSEDETREQFHQILKILRQVPQESIQMLVNLFVKNME